MIDIDTFYRRLFRLPHDAVIYAHQRETFEALWHEPVGCVYLLSAPCGSGKTEAVVAPFLAQFAERKFPIAPRLIYVLPSRALAKQIHNRLSRAAKAISQKIVCNLHCGGHPHDTFLFGDIVVTTLDHFIYCYARAAQQLGKHLDVPAGCIASSLVVFDEAHMFDDYTHSLMRAMLEILYAAHVPAMLMTATLPNSLFVDFGEQVRLKPIEYRGDLRIRRYLDFELWDGAPCKPGKRESQGQDALVQAVGSLVEGHNRVLIVRNRVRDSQKTYDALSRLGYEPVLVHSRFTNEDRRLHEDEVVARLGKNGSGGIVVSTQVCEAGLDISCDLLITDLAPADSLVQRIGRCARFGGHGRVVVFYASERPYRERDLNETWNYLTTHRDTNLAEWSATQDFVNILDYHVDDVAARDSLLDLLECTLFADTKPQNIRVREGKYLTGVVIAPDSLKNLSWGDCASRSLSLDIRVARACAASFAKKGGSHFMVLKPDPEAAGKLPKPQVAPELYPMGTFLLDPSHYDKKLGLTYD